MDKPEMDQISELLNELVESCVLNAQDSTQHRIPLSNLANQSSIDHQKADHRESYQNKENQKEQRPELPMDCIFPKHRLFHELKNDMSQGKNLDLTKRYHHDFSRILVEDMVYLNM